MKKLKEIFLDFNESKKTVFNNTILDIKYLRISKSLNDNSLDRRFFQFIELIGYYQFVLGRTKRVVISFKKL